MKRIKVLILAIVIIGSQGYSQPWNKLLPPNKKEYTFYDYKKAFDDYWAPYNVDNGWYKTNNGEKKKAMGWKPFKRWEEHWSTRVNIETGEFPNTNAAFEYKKHIAKYGSYKSNFSNWVSLGPSYNSNMADTLNLGRVNIIEFHPSDPDVMWIGTPAGGLWVTDNGGTSWIPLTDDLDVLGVSAIVIPSDYDASQTIYIGTGDRDAYDNPSTGVYKSTDAGATWVQTSLAFEPQYTETVNRMLLLPSDDQIIYAATSNGVYKTTNAANTWTQLNTVEFIDMEFCPSDPTIMYGVTRSGSIYTSTNAGTDWNNVFSNSSGRMEIAVTPDAPEIVYVVGANNSSGLKGIYRSNDFGQNFSLVFDDYNLLDWDANGSGNSGQGWYDLCLAADPTNGSVLYCGGINTWRSNDNGETWELVNHMLGSTGVEVVHADQHYLNFWHNTSKLYECNDGGVFVSDNGTDWDNISNTLTIGQLYRLDVASSDSLLTLIGMQDNGFKRYAEDGWYDLTIFADGMECLIDYEDNQIQYVSSQFGNLRRTNNNWGSFINIANNIPGGANGAWVTPYTLCPVDHNTLYVGYANLWKSTDNGDSFETLHAFGAQLQSLTTSPVNPNYIYAATTSNIFISSDAGENWQNITNGLPSATINYISVKYNDPNTIWVSLGGYNQHGVYETTDGGATWANISNGLPEIPVNCVIQNNIETMETQLYAATDYKVFVKNGDANWTLYANGLPNVIVRELDIYYDYDNLSSSKLRAATYGRGLWESNLNLSGAYGVMLTTRNPEGITLNEASLNGEIVQDLGTTISQSGFVLSSEPNPEIGAANVTVLETSPLVTTGEFSLSIDNLQSNTLYYYRAYAINENITSYGEVITFSTLCDVISDFPLSENVDGSNALPICWSEEFVSGDNIPWEIASGNGSSSLPNAHSGNNNFLFRDSDLGDDKTLLKLPVLDLSTLQVPALKFWLSQPKVFGVIDELRVLYKSSESGSWVELADLNTELPNWTEMYLQLPDASSSYYIAFEGNAKFGGGVCIDDVSVVESIGVAAIEDEEVYIYPNPSKDVVNIVIDNQFIGSALFVYDLSGKICVEEILENKNNIVDIQNLTDGMYIIEIKSKSKTIQRKIVVE